MRVLAALSGGVDSAVAAARIHDAGHEVVGVHLALSRAEHVSGSRGCCSADDARDARRVADKLDIPFYVWDMHEEFTESVMENFIAEYQAGHTPNPCLRCNESIKFAAVLDRALGLGFDAVCTGHYARLIDTATGRELHRAVDPAKDQSYVLGVLQADQLAHSMFPLGASIKEDVRAEAEQRGLLVASKPDSHDICFIPDGDTQGFLVDRIGAQPGRIVDAATGEQVGEHQGTFTVTIGQRRGLNLKIPAEDGNPRYVIDVDAKSDTVYVGAVDDLDVWTLSADHVVWTGPRIGTQRVDVQAQVRAHHTPVPARAWFDGRRLHVELIEPVRGLARGQSAVLYDGSRVVGSGRVESTDRTEALPAGRVS